MQYLIVFHGRKEIGYVSFPGEAKANEYLDVAIYAGSIRLFPVPAQLGGIVSDDGTYLVPMAKVHRVVMVSDPASLPINTGLPV